ncbi:hypothetical protein C8R45DRAFT_1145542 [Mycena sanguinolenta]|nr:hypothetical protein C8R45DRAFT_1145542 [Mycena sanguinolenta]
MLSRIVDYLFSAPPVPPTPAPPEMRVVPCSALDVEQRHTVLTIGLVIDSPLDPHKLECSLSTLVERKFPRAGARLAIRNNVYEFQIPCTFDSNTPAIAFTAYHHYEPYLSPKRPDLRLLLSCTDSKPLVHRFPSLREYLVSKTCPTSTSKFVGSKIPMLHVHVSVFDDLTLIGVTAPQMLFDVPGLKMLLRAWCRVLAGDDIEALPGMEWDTAPFETFRSSAPAWCVRGYWCIVPKFYPDTIYEPFIPLAVSWVLDQFRDREEKRLIRVPKAFLEDRRQEIMGNLKLQESGEQVTTFDVLVVWWVQTSHSLRRSDSPKELFIHIPADLRSQPIFSNMSTLNKPYINNASSTISVPPLPSAALHTESLGDLALRIRQVTRSWSAEPLTLQDELRWRNKNLDYRIFNLHRCPPGHRSELQTNWCDARFGDLDFSGALPANGEKLKPRLLFFLTDPVLSTDYMSNDDLIRYSCMSFRGNGAILLEDENAVWMSQVIGRRDWERLGRNGHLRLISF